MAEVGFWSEGPLDLGDEINADIWDRSPAIERAIRAGREPSPGDVQQGRYGLPWVPDLVGNRWREQGSMHVVGSAYSPFFDDAQRDRRMSLDAYRMAGSQARFQRIFVRDVVRGDENYYEPLVRLIASTAGPGRFVLTDLVRGCFVAKDGELRGDKAVRADRELFMEYARAGWHWTWHRLIESEADLIVALGGEAASGLRRLLKAQGLEVVDDGSDVGSPRQWEASGEVGGRHRVWRLYRAYHPAWAHALDPGYGGAIAALQSILAGKPARIAPSRRSIVPGRVASVARCDRVSTSPKGRDYWAMILRGGPAPKVGLLLAKHPDSPRLTKQLVADLSVPRLVAIADALHNKCRPREMEQLAPANPARQSELAWQALLHWAEKVYDRPSGWTGAVRLLEHGQVAGLATVRELAIQDITRVGAWIVTGPYQDTTHGIRSR